MSLSRVEDRILGILRSATSERPRINPTELYCEGWLLRLVLSALESGLRCLPFAMAPEARWASEPRLYTAFGARFRSDRVQERHTHADGVVGHFHFGASKSGVQLLSTATQFITLEAKIYSKLSARTKNAQDFDQAARYIGCMAEILKRAMRPIESYRSLGFYLMAPESRIRAGIFNRMLDPESIRCRLQARIRQYAPNTQVLNDWYENWVMPLLQICEIKAVTWEETIESIAAQEPELGSELQIFYEYCLRFNAPKADVGIEVPGQQFRVLPLR